MVLSMPLIVLILLFLVMVIIGAVKDEFRASAFWFQCLVGVAILLTFGFPR